MTWLVDKLSVDDVVDVVLYKRRIERDVDGVHCVATSVCGDNVVAYLIAKAFMDAQAEVRAAGLKMLKDAFRRGLYHEDEAVFRRAREVFNVNNTTFGDEHVQQARKLIADELRRCVVCKIDVFTLFERFIRCIEVDSVNFTYAIRRDDRGVFHVIVKYPADAPDAINRLLTAQYRVTVDSDLETFEALTRIHAKPFC